MRKTDALDVLAGVVAAFFDAVFVFGGFLLATWARFDSGWLSMRHARPEPLYPLYAAGAGVGALVFLLIFRSVGLYVRPQTGAFTGKIPRLVRACGLGVLLSMVLAFAAQNEADFSRLVLGMSFPLVTVLVLLERYLLFRLEWNLGRHSRRTHPVLIVGVDAVAGRLRRTLAREPMLRCRVAGFLRLDGGAPDPAIAPAEILGGLEALPDVLKSSAIRQVIVSTGDLPRERVMEIVLECERNLAAFNMVPDLFRIMTSSMDVQSLDDIPLLGLRAWPLDRIRNRILKRAEDLVGAAVGLALVAPVIAAAAVAIKRTSRGTVFYRQERCGRNGTVFRIWKLRTMRMDAEAATGPVFAAEDDSRRTPVGGFLRRHNLDELPQLWNVLRGEMSLVGPRPERPHFVEKFREDVGRYMWRHVSKPGLTGWAQVNGMRGNTSIEERVRYDLYYLEHWSVAFDFKILLKTVFARENAY